MRSPTSCATLQFDLSISHPERTVAALAQFRLSPQLAHTALFRGIDPYEAFGSERIPWRRDQSGESGRLFIEFTRLLQQRETGYELD